MSKHGTWTVIFDDNVIIKRTGEFDKATAKALVTGGTDFWNQSKFSNIHAIQFTNDNIDNDQVEFKDDKPNGSYDESVYGSFQQFIDLWDAAYLSELQEKWDDDNVETDGVEETVEETVEQKVLRLGSRPTSYSS